LKELQVDPSTLEVHDKKEFVSITTKHGLGKGSIKLNEVRQSVDSRKAWGSEQEPVDISRSLDNLNIMEIAFYDQFISKNSGIIENPKQKKVAISCVPELENIFQQVARVASQGSLLLYNH